MLFITEPHGQCLTWGLGAAGGAKATAFSSNRAAHLGLALDLHRMIFSRAAGQR